MYSQFCDKYRHWARLTKTTMRIQHHPGNTMQVDWTGATIPLHAKYTGNISYVYLFVVVLPCSCKAYVEPCENMKREPNIKNINTILKNGQDKLISSISEADLPVPKADVSPISRGSAYYKRGGAR